MSDQSFEIGKAVTISYSDLIDPTKLESLYPKLSEAFGDEPDCLGLVLISDLPDTFPSMRRQALSYSYHLAHLPDADLATLEDEKSSYLVGWSRGREMFMGKPDMNKGSFYVNPTHDYDPSQVTETTFPEYESPNRWPSKQLPGFQRAVEELGQFIVSVGSHVARACDSYVKTKVPDYSANHLEAMVNSSRTCKARLLHYFARTEPPSSKVQDAWCGEHLDHGCLTGLTSAMFIHDPTGATKADGGSQTSSEHGDKAVEMLELDASPDSNSGLFIRSRSGRTVKIQIPRSCLAFQTGEALERTTGGALKAVPHYVAGCSVPHVARTTLAVFMQPNLDDVLGVDGRTFKAFARGIVDENTTR